MTDKLVIRETTAGDVVQVLALYPQAFPEEELRPVVTDLLKEGTDVLSLAGFDGKVLVAHVVFTACGTAGENRGAALLAPLGVKPSHQQQGLGSSLVRAGLQQLEDQGIRQVFVLGDPAYYQRFGFLPERQVLTPYPIPENWADAWQSMLLAGGKRMAAGCLSVLDPWMEPTLWAP